MSRVEFGDCRDTMRRWAEQGVKVQTCVTSPPYFGLRDYGHPGQLGLEKTPEEFVGALVEVFRCVRDVLADDGTLWLNIGDSYARTGGTDRKVSASAQVGITRNTLEQMSDRTSNASALGLKSKDLIGIPWMLAFALRADGWYLRQEIIWAKPNPMPESVRDRCTKSHESIFLLAKRPTYYFDHEAIKEPACKGAAGSDFHTGKTGEHQLGRASEKPRGKRDSFKRDDSKRAAVIPGQTVGTHRADRDESAYDTGTRNKRSVWTVATTPYSGAHFATFPSALIEPCILAGSKPGQIVLDPFFGSGTTGMVAQNLGRRWLGCELNEAYKPLQDERLQQPGLMLEAA